ncbi:hypothetical protein Q4583_06395 [Neptunomonas phycophila]|uniref:ABC-three component system protein n=1 Tax=Neptunomonas phycophila TaxID=1572645 RepID=UPI0026E3581C|nr:ABC-three component system protein [Neptunomonas phycophila]MDO6783736.1 hypothetical protein [Neptunomonas phycophila]
MKNSNQFDATASALGYIYQVRYGLLMGLKKIQEVDDPDNCLISIEKLDDIAFEESGSPTELLQTKYHGTAGNITDRSSDLWKTIRVWAEMYSDAATDFESITFTLITTEATPDESIASMLGVEQEKRNTNLALERMRSISKETSNKDNSSGYDAFSSLDDRHQKSLVDSIYVIANSPSILTVEEKIRKQVRLSVSSNFIDAFITRLEGVWFKKNIEIMSVDDQYGLSLGELASIVDDLRIQFLPGNLPSDFDDDMPDAIDIENDGRAFVEQLRLINATDRVIRQAIINYYRAYEQRSRWSREGLVNPGEIKKYLNRLQDEWNNQASLLEMSGDLSAVSGKIAFGKNLYQVCQTQGSIAIRSEFKPAYVSRGTYHSLSDDLKIGWHPDFESLLESANDQGAA